MYTICIYISLSLLTRKPNSGFIYYYIRSTEAKTQGVTCGFVTTHRETAERKKKIYPLPTTTPLNK